MLTHQEFLAEIDAFLARTGMSPSALGRAALNDPSFVRDIRSGRSPRLAIIARVDKFMRAHADDRAQQQRGAAGRALLEGSSP
jgi:hypothetical protein